jgi:hypothetical protein
MYLCEGFTDGQIERVNDVTQTSQRAHVVGGGQVFVVRVVGLQDVLAVTVLGHHAQQVLVVAAVVLPLDGHHAPRDRTRTAKLA